MFLPFFSNFYYFDLLSLPLPSLQFTFTTPSNVIRTGSTTSKLLLLTQAVLRNRRSALHAYSSRKHYHCHCSHTVDMPKCVGSTLVCLFSATASQGDGNTRCFQHHFLYIVHYISGGDAYIQMESELCALSPEEREALLHGANLPVQIPPDHALAIKADLALPWAKIRVMSR